MIADIIAQQQAVYVSRRHGDIGDGDVCPLFPEHGRMFVLAGSDPPKQWCPHSAHTPPTLAKNSPPPSRSQWPLYGFEESVATYFARLDREIREGGVTL